MAKTPRTWTGARTPSGLKRVRQAARRHEVLGPRRSAAKTYVAKALTLAANPVEGSDTDDRPDRGAQRARSRGEGRCHPPERRRAPQVAPDPQGQRRPRRCRRADVGPRHQADRQGRRGQGRQGPHRGRQVDQGQGRPDRRRQGSRRAEQDGPRRGCCCRCGRRRGERRRDGTTEAPAKTTKAAAKPAAKADAEDHRQGDDQGDGQDDDQGDRDRQGRTEEEGRTEELRLLARDPRRSDRPGHPPGRRHVRATGLRPWARRVSPRHAAERARAHRSTRCAGPDHRTCRDRAICRARGPPTRVATREPAWPDPDGDPASTRSIARHWMAPSGAGERAAVDARAYSKHHPRASNAWRSRSR